MTESCRNMEKALSRGRKAASVTGAGDRHYRNGRAQTQQAPIAICTANAESTQ